MFAFDTGMVYDCLQRGPARAKGKTMNTECKPEKTLTGDYTYRGVYIIAPHTEGNWAVGRRGNNGYTTYRRFKTLKAACAYIDKNWACK